MLYVIFNPDGSIKTLVVGESIQQGDHETKQIFTKIEGIDPSEYTCSADFVLPNGELSYLIASQVTDESDDEYGEGYSITLTEGQTYLAGNLKMNLRLVDLQGHVLCTYQVTLKINPTAYSPDDTNITEAQYNSFLQSLASYITVAWADENLPQKNAVLNILTDLDIDGDTTIERLNSILQEEIGLSQCITFLTDENSAKHLCCVRITHAELTPGRITWFLRAIEMNGKGYYEFSGFGTTTIANALKNSYHTYLDAESEQVISGLKIFDSPADRDGIKIHFDNDNEGGAIGLYPKDGNGEVEHGYLLGGESSNLEDDVNVLFPAKSGTLALKDYEFTTNFASTDTIEDVYQAVLAKGKTGEWVKVKINYTYYRTKVSTVGGTARAITIIDGDGLKTYYYSPYIQNTVTLSEFMSSTYRYTYSYLHLYEHSVDFSYNGQMENLTFISNSPTKLSDLASGQSLKTVGFGKLTHFAAPISPIDAIITSSYIYRNSDSFSIIYRSWSSPGTETSINVAISNISGTESVTEL